MEKEISKTDFLKEVAFEKSLGNFCAYYYNLYIKNLLGTNDGFENFVLILKWDHNSNETIAAVEFFSEDEYKKTTSSIQPIIKKIIDNMINESVTEDEFYSRLWEFISGDSLFPSELEKICSIVALVLEPRIPYYELGQALQMDNDKYQEVSDSIDTEISRALFVLRCGYSQNTQVASQLYKIMKEIDDEEKRIVLLANVIGYFNAKFIRLYKKFSPDED